MNKAVFLDRDGTINVEKNYLYRIEDFEFIDGSIDAMRMLQDAGYLLIIITNQSGIARGYYSEDDFLKLNSWMTETLKNEGVKISKVYYCPHLPTASVEDYRQECCCRKPKTGMFLQAVSDYQLDLNQCYAIGDKIRDLAICDESNCQGFLISDHEKPDVIEQAQKGLITRVRYASDLSEAAKSIIDG